MRLFNVLFPCFLFFHLCLTVLLFLVSSGDRTTSNSSKDSTAGISNTSLHNVVGTVSASTAAASNTTASSATSLMSKALAGFGTAPSKPKSSGLAAAIVAQAASEAKQQQPHQMAAAVNNISSRTTGNAALQNSSPISAGRNSILAKLKQNFGLDAKFLFYTLVDHKFSNVKISYD